MDFARFAPLLLLILAAGSILPLRAVQFSGQVRAADQIVPGATVTALQGGAKLTAFTDENGRYSLDLTPGVWQIEVSMFEFTTAKGQVTVSGEGIAKDWVLNMPKLSERGGAVAAAGAPGRRHRCRRLRVSGAVRAGIAATDKGRGEAATSRDGKDAARRVRRMHRADAGKVRRARRVERAAGDRDAEVPGRGSRDSKARRCGPPRKASRQMRSSRMRHRSSWAAMRTKRCW